MNRESSFFTKENNTTISTDDIIFQTRFLEDKIKAVKTVSTFSTISNAEKKWSILINVTYAIIKMRKFKIERISTEMVDQFFQSNAKASKSIPPLDTNKDSSIRNDNPMDYITEQIKLFQYIENGVCDEEQIKKILKIPKIINDTNYEGATPLYAACANGHVNIAKILIENGADHLKKNKENETCLEAAARFNYVALIEYLLKACKWPEKIVINSIALTKRGHKKSFILLKRYLKSRGSSICRCF